MKKLTVIYKETETADDRNIKEKLTPEELLTFLFGKDLNEKE